MPPALLSSATATTAGAQPALPLRDPGTVMRLSRLGSLHLSRLSFSRSLIRRIRAGGWQVRRHDWQIGPDGFGHAIYAVEIGARCISLVAFSRDLPADQRIDRVIATAWDTSYVLYDGLPDAAELARLAATVPRQEACRYTERELILARANRSVRLFDETVSALAEGRQPDHGLIRRIGYLLRTSAVYGNGKFGIADRDQVIAVPGLDGAFTAEMLTVWLIRNFSVELAEHCARMRAPDRAIRLAPRIRRDLGVGNSTGLGMAPFLVRHPVLLDRWIRARETALARVRAQPAFPPDVAARLLTLLATAREKARFWVTDDPDQSADIAQLRTELSHVARWLAAPLPAPETLFRRAQTELGAEAGELVISLLIDAFDGLTDDLCSTMAGEELPAMVIDGARTAGEMRDRIARQFGWALDLDFTDPESSARFWYTSQEKLEPRLGWRGDDAGDELEQPLGIGREIAALDAHLARLPPEIRLADMLAAHPELRLALRRVQVAEAHPYGEIRDNLLAAAHRPRDLMRCKLSFLGCEFFDPGSELSLRVRFFQGAPFPDDLSPEAGDGFW